MQQVGVKWGFGWRARDALAQQTLAGTFLTHPYPVAFTISEPAHLARPLSAHTRRWGPGRTLLLAAFALLTGALALNLLSVPGRQQQSARGLMADLEQLTFLAGFGIEQVAVTGQRMTPDGDIFDALDLANVRSMVGFDSADLRQRIERLPWVATATLTRVYPDRLDIRVTERKPFALWRRGRQEHLIDVTGRVLGPVEPGSISELPLFIGDGAAAEASSFLALVARFPFIAQRLDAAERVAGRRWTLHLKDGVKVHLAAGREAALLMAASADGRLTRLLASQDLIIDLRSPGRITFRAGHADVPAPESGRMPRT